MPERCVALLRGINVGRAKRIGMADLRALVAGLGYREVSTLLNSGNVVFTATTPASQAAAASRIEAALASALGVTARVTVLTAADLDVIVAENPLGAVADNHSRLLVTVITDPADVARAAALGARTWGTSVLAIGTRAIYAWCPDGISASELPDAIGKAIGDRGTGRNWATITKLRALVG